MSAFWRMRAADAGCGGARTLSQAPLVSRAKSDVGPCAMHAHGLRMTIIVQFTSSIHIYDHTICSPFIYPYPYPYITHTHAIIIPITFVIPMGPVRFGCETTVPYIGTRAIQPFARKAVQCLLSHAPPPPRPTRPHICLYNAGGSRIGPTGDMQEPRPHCCPTACVGAHAVAVGGGLSANLHVVCRADAPLVGIMWANVGGWRAYDGKHCIFLRANG